MPQPERESRRPDHRALLAAYDRAWWLCQREPSAQNLALLRVGEEIIYRALLAPGRVALGQVVATPGALDAMAVAGHIAPEFLLRHKNEDWGELDELDRAENERALLHGSRLFSAYSTRREEKLWVITESDRSATTILKPAEY